VPRSIAMSWEGNRRKLKRPIICLMLAWLSGRPGSGLFPLEFL
jgi:hypothetical protein